MIKSVIFDIGNVLLYFKPMEFLNKYYKDKDTINTLYKLVFKSDEWVSLDRGTITVEGAINNFSKREPKLKNEIRFVMENWHEMHTPIAETVKLLNKLKNEGYHIYLLSNYHVEAFDYIDKRYDFIRNVDGKIISSHYKLLKPEEKIYTTLLNKYNLKPEECVFIDDTLLNVEAANKLGIHGICFKGAAPIYNLIKSFN